MEAWTEFAGVVAFVAAIGWLLWNDATRWYELARPRRELRNLSSDVDLAESA